LFQERQEEYEPADSAGTIGSQITRVGTGTVVGVGTIVQAHLEVVLGIVIGMTREGKLLQLVGALHPPCGFSGGLHRWQKKGNKNADDGDDDKKFDESETSFP
jgi:hypothetical protein